MKPTDVDSRELALSRLAVREYSAREMTEYLERKGVPANESSAIVADLVRSRVIDDHRYAIVAAREQSRHDRGPGQLQMKLQQRGISLGTEEARVLFNAASDRSELELAASVLERRYPRASTSAAERRRAYVALLRRGFSSTAAKQAFAQRGLATDDLPDEDGSADGASLSELSPID